MLDTVGRAMQGVNENAQEHASNFTRLVDRLRHELGATVLALHHTGHETSTRARGSSVFGADADNDENGEPSGIRKISMIILRCLQNVSNSQLTKACSFLVRFRPH